MRTKQYELIICSVNLEFSEKVIKIAKDLGVLNATSIKGRGTGIYETESFMGMEIQPEKEIIFLVVPKQHRRKVMQSVAETAGIYTENHGLIFSLPIEDWTGTLSKIAIPKPSPVLKDKSVEVAENQEVIKTAGGSVEINTVSTPNAVEVNKVETENDSGSDSGKE